MSKKVKRKINIGNEVFHWVADYSRLELFPFKEMHIRVHQSSDTKSILYIDANAWHFELTPQYIKKAIEFALANNWNPNQQF